MTISTRLERATSSHAPSSGPDSAPGSVAAAAVTPANVVLPVRARTRSTPAVLNIVTPIRENETVNTNRTYPGLRRSLCSPPSAAVVVKPITGHGGAPKLQPLAPDDPRPGVS